MKNIISYENWLSLDSVQVGQVLLPRTRRTNALTIDVSIDLRNDSIVLQFAGLVAVVTRVYDEILKAPADKLEDLLSISVTKPTTREIPFETIEQATRAGHRLIERLEAYAINIKDADRAEYEASIKGLETD